MGKQLKLIACSVLVLMTSAVTNVAASPHSRCLAGKNQCVSKTAGALLKCEQRAETPGRPADPNAGGCVDTAKAKFDSGSDPTMGCFEKLESMESDCRGVCKRGHRAGRLGERRHTNAATNVAASVSGGQRDTSSGIYASVSGGYFNAVSGWTASVSGGYTNRASGDVASVTAGLFNVASAAYATVSGGVQNTASGGSSSVSGGLGNTASGTNASVSGGVCNVAGQGPVPSCGFSPTGDIFQSVSGGFENLASGPYAAVGGGNGVTAAGSFEWHADQSPGFPTGSQY